MKTVSIDPRKTNTAWGVLIPHDNGIPYSAKVGGICVGQYTITGSFAPLPRPVTDEGDLLQEIQRANKDRTSFPQPLFENNRDRWNEIMETLDIEFHVVNPSPDAFDQWNPDTVPDNVEGLYWIEIDRADSHRLNWLETIPQPVALITGNSD